jgi:hypothetical protein
MSPDQIRIVGVGSLYLLIFVSGIRLSRAGKPYSTALLTVHKLISLAAAALLVMAMVRAHQTAGLDADEWIAGLVTGLLFVGTIASGGLLSVDKAMPAAIRTAHRITPVLTVLATAATFYLLGRT